jgi:hypothetical protein
MAGAITLTHAALPYHRQVYLCQCFLANVAATAACLALVLLHVCRTVLLLLCSSCYHHCCCAVPLLLLLMLLLVLQDVCWEVVRGYLLSPRSPSLLCCLGHMHMPRCYLLLGRHLCLLPRVLL